jgi:putative FmdB family regulatory protein
MPIYEYQCQKCHHTFEDLVGMGWADEPSCCPKCHSHNVKRVLSKFSFFDSSNTWRGTKDGSNPVTSPSGTKDAGSKSASPSGTKDAGSKSASPSSAKK